jgi:aspartate-semialdehyde dehydrogenase
MSRAAILEPNGLLGKELREQLASRPELATEIKLFTQRDEEVGALTEVGGAAAMVQAFTLDDLDAIDLLFHCEPRAEEIAYLGRLPPSLGLIVVTPSIPIPQGHPALADDDDEPAARGDVLVSPHPAVVGLAHLLRPLQALGLEEAVATLLLPASIYDQDALEEVFAQTRALLEFKRPAAGKRFSEQLAFNVLPGPPDEAVIVEHLAALVPGVPRLSAHSLQAGVFHGLGLSVFCQLEAGAGPDDVVAALSGHEHIELAETPESVGPVAAATGDTAGRFLVVGRARQPDARRRQQCDRGGQPVVDASLTRV